jgi:hypothetical protein
MIKKQIHTDTIEEITTHKLVPCWKTSQGKQRKDWGKIGGIGDITNMISCYHIISY